MGGAPSVSAPAPPNAGQELTQAIQGYVANAPALYGEESQYQPMYNALQQGMEQQNINQYAQQYFGLMPQAQQAANLTQQQATANQLGMMQTAGPAVTQALMASSPQYGQLANMATSQMGAGLDPTLTGLYGNVMGAMPGQVQGFQNLASQAAGQLTPINQQLQSLAGQSQVGTDQTTAQLGQLQQNVLANARSDIFNATKGNVMGALGNLDPLTQQLSSTAQQQMALGGQMSPQMAADVAQQQRAAYSARGMLQSTGSIGAEVMGQQQMQQQLLSQREQFAQGVAPLVQNEQQQRTANALGLTSTDIQATLANQQLGANIGQSIAGIQQANIGLQSGLQGQIASNLQNAIQQQAGLQGQALSAYQGAISQAGALQGQALQQQLAQQQFGAGIGQYLTGQQQAAMSAALGIGAQPTGAQLTSAAAGLNAYGTGGPALFQSSGMLGLVNQNQMAGYNANMSARMATASGQSAQSGSLMGAGASIGGAAIGGIALVGGAALL
jgi:hypothetical protein